MQKANRSEHNANSEVQEQSQAPSMNLEEHEHHQRHSHIKVYVDTTKKPLRHITYKHIHKHQFFCI